MRQHAQSSPSPTSAKKLPPPPFPKVPDDNLSSSYQETGGRNEAENLNNSTKPYMSATISASSKLSLKKQVIHESPDPVIRPQFLRHRQDKRSNLNPTASTTLPSNDFEMGKVGYSSVCYRVFEILTACITLMSTHSTSSHHHHHHHHYHNLELHNYPVAYLRLIEMSGSPSHDLKVVEPPTATGVNLQPQSMDVEEAGKIMVTDMHIQQVERYSSTSGNEPMKAAVEHVSQITNDKGRITLEKGKGEDFRPKANPMIRNWGFDLEDDDNRPSLVPIFVVTAIGSVMVLVVLICCLLGRKRRNDLSRHYHRHLEHGLLHTQNPDMPETLRSSSSSSSVRGRGAPSVQQPFGKNNKWVTSKARMR